MQGWYQSLILPDFVPSGQFIGIIWTVLYALLALSAIMAMDEWPRRSPGRLAAFYLVNGILNVAWCYLFFTLHRIDVAFLACIALLLSVALLIVENFRFKRFAGFLLLPYLIWVAFAGYLNYSIWSLNHNVQPPQISSEGNSAEKLDRIRLSTPAAGDVIKSPLHIEGEARGTWYFEASFPVTLEDGNGTVLASGHADAKSDWMTEDFVPFTADLSFKSPSTNTGRLVLHRDNPSGLPENDDELWVPVAFKSITASENLSNLKVGDSFVHGNIRGKVIEINDSRCKSGVVCIWQGEISVVLSVALNGDSDVPGGTIRIGTEVRQSETLLGHTFSLRSAAADSVTLVITP
jgi:tryptophan-rich sensory protein